MPFYTRNPIDTLIFSDPFFTNFLNPAHHNTPHTSHNGTGDSIRAFSPNFDVHETPKEYILEGELPGIEDKKAINIEFTDANTLVVRGKIERSYTSGTPPSGAIEGTSMKGAITEAGEKEGEQQNKDQLAEKKQEKQDKHKQDKQEEKTKYWVSERTVGSFQRSFSFPGEIDQDGVKASLAHGLLKVIVPKNEKRRVKRVEVD